MPVSGQFGAVINLLDTRSGGAEESVVKILRDISVAFVDGVGAGAINAIWQDIRPLTDGGNENLDVSPTPAAVAGTARVVTFARIKGFAIYSPPTNTTNLTVSRHASAGVALFTATGDGLAPITPSGFFVWCAPSATGLVVTPTTADIVAVLTNSAGAAATYGVVIAGALT